MSSLTTIYAAIVALAYGLTYASPAIVALYVVRKSK